MFNQVKKIAFGAAMISLGLGFMLEGLQAILYGNVLDDNAFKKALLDKHITQVYISHDKVWFFEKGRTHKSPAIQWEMYSKDKREFFVFLRQYHIRAITEPSFFQKYRNILSSVLICIVGLLVFLAGIGGVLGWISLIS